MIFLPPPGRRRDRRALSLKQLLLKSQGGEENAFHFLSSHTARVSRVGMNKQAANFGPTKFALLISASGSDVSTATTKVSTGPAFFFLKGFHPPTSIALLPQDVMTFSALSFLFSSHFRFPRRP